MNQPECAVCGDPLFNPSQRECDECIGELAEQIEATVPDGIRSLSLTRGVRRALERALGWPENQIDTILQGKRRAPAPRRSSVTGHRIFTADTVGRWQQALTAIAEPGCLQMARTCCCHVRHLPHLDWCAPCVAHNALNPHARDIEVQR